ncbi:hypothetical protein OIU77_023942 [Salix suchowensis]|uniref:FCP1 homology domain-containing protein n=1 Tax=Salix suchowensis TaxID=1278906 RepID=A0ABQ9C9C8_9ROSI|nr:hypothetical protein OIU77_023942 [Salix suchowensis]
MKWVELKMGQLGVLNNPNYKITALLDHLAMITVQSDSRGIFDCKPLGLIWAKFPEFYSSKNTIMFDDLRRNFRDEPKKWLEIDDLSVLDHKNWEFYAEGNAKNRRHT